MVSPWHRHPGVRSGDQLTLGERAADRMRATMGSWPFVFGFFTFMAVWVVINSFLHVGGPRGFDVFPYVLLNLFLSMLAGVQAAALLIAAKRADRIAGELAQHDFEINQHSLEILTKLDTLTTEVHAHITGTS